MRTYKTLNGLPLQASYHITIEDKEDGTEYGSKVVTFHSRIHVRRSKTCPVTYSKAFGDNEILRDSYLLGWVNSCYGEVTA